LRIAWPFTRVDVALGPPIEPSGAGSREQVQTALRMLNARGAA
jgi:hypothetical protein